MHAKPISKLQRWIDLIAALLGRHYPVTLEDLQQDLPGYGDGEASSRRRMFERDKAELRRLGVPIQTITLDDGESAAYQLRSSEFYLPYLGQIGMRTGGGAKRIDRYGYRGLPTLLFEPEELRFVFRAAERIGRLGAGALSDAANSGLGKLRFDLGGVALHAHATQEETILSPRAVADRHVLNTLMDALKGQKRVEIDYYSIGVDALATRLVEPYGLFLVGGNWYLAARDVRKDALRTFRASRIRDARINESRPAQADFRVPAAFSIREYAKSRQAWEIGEDEAIRAIVEFHGESGTVATGARLGRVVGGDERLREFDVRRVDVFARWLLSFGGEATPKAPAKVVDAFYERVRAALVVHSKEPGGTPASRETESGNVPRSSNSRRRTDAPNETATAQLLRLFALLPVLGSQEMVDLSSLPARTGVPIETVLQDLTAVTERMDVPAGFVDPIQVYLEGTKVGLVTSQFLRPPRLNHDELLALELGLAMLRSESPPDDHPWIDRARVRLRAALTSAEPAAGFAASSEAVAADGFGTATEQDREILRTLRTAFAERRKAQIEYRARAETTQRVVRVYAFAYGSGAWYVIAHCDDRAAIRRFRLDRIGAAEILDESYEIPARFDVAVEAGDHRVLSSLRAHETLRVRFGPRVARWIAEREGGDVVNGTVTVDYPLLDADWAVWYVLQYGADAEVIEPEFVRDAIRERLSVIARTAEVSQP